MIVKFENIGEKQIDLAPGESRRRSCRQPLEHLGMRPDDRGILAEQRRGSVERSPMIMSVFLSGTARGWPLLPVAEGIAEV